MTKSHALNLYHSIHEIPFTPSSIIGNVCIQAIGYSDALYTSYGISEIRINNSEFIMAFNNLGSRNAWRADPHSVTFTPVSGSASWSGTHTLTESSVNLSITYTLGLSLIKQASVVQAIQTAGVGSSALTIDFFTSNTPDVRLHVENDKATLSNEVPLQFNSRVDLTDSNNNIVHQDISSILTTMQTDTLAAASSNNTDVVQQNLDNYIATNNAAVATNGTNLTAATIVRQAQVTNMNNNVTGLINSESTARTVVDVIIGNNVSQENTDMQNAVTSIASTRSSAITALTTLLDAQRLRINSILVGSTVNLDTLAKVSTAFAAADVPLQNAVNAMQTQLTALQATVNTLVAASFPTSNSVLYIPNYSFDGSNHDNTFEYYYSSEHFYQLYGIDKIGISSSFFTVEFKDSQCFNDWLNYTLPSETRSVTITSTNGSSYTWEGTHTLVEYSNNSSFNYIHYQLGGLSSSLMNDFADHVASAGAGSNVISLEFS